MRTNQAPFYNIGILVFLSDGMALRSLTEVNYVFSVCVGIDYNAQVAFQHLICLIIGAPDDYKAK